MMPKVNIFWFRRDLRLHDNTGLYHALNSGTPVLPVFVFDTNILDDLEAADGRLQFIHQELQAIQMHLAKSRRGIWFFHGKPEEAFKKLLGEFEIEKVFTNHDYDPYAIQRDKTVQNLLNNAGVSMHTYKDQVVFEKSKIMKEDGDPYVVFTPYSRKWKAELNNASLKNFPSEKLEAHFYEHDAKEIPSLNMMGFKTVNIEYPARTADKRVLKQYEKERDFPAMEGTTRLGVHLRFGTISIRNMAALAKTHSDTYLNELIWREFYQMILWQFPHVGEGKAFKPEFDHIRWRNNEKEFGWWCAGETGYPIVDAGMRQLNETGYMHNRVRMVTASFLSKHLLVDWRWGEAYFASKLLDYEFASNNGGWQWTVGSGCDAAPYFRIFNPLLQAKKFDPNDEYVKRWVPEFGNNKYPSPIVEHDYARKRCLEVFGKVVSKNNTGKLKK